MSCPTGRTNCGSCRDLQTDAENCGACGNICGAGQLCRRGVCVSCPSGMTLIPADTFSMGDSRFSDATPHRVALAAFCMDNTEVTVAAYRTCSTCAAPLSGSACNWGASGRDLHPINCVNWNLARAYCQSIGRDLPTEAQWEYAARGTDGRSYPWGNAAPGSQLCWNRAPVPMTTCPVQSYPLGNSPFGLSDMEGNVVEWTLDWYGIIAADPVSDPTGPSSGTTRAYRGASFLDSDPNSARAARRVWAPPGSNGYDNGFRCASALP